SEADARLLLHYLNIRGPSVEPPGPPTGAKPEPAVEASVATDLEAAVRHAQVHVGIRVHNAAEADLRPNRDLALDCNLLYLEDSVAGMNALAYIESRCAAATARFLEYRLRQLHVQQRAVPVIMERNPLRDNAAKSNISIAALVPLVLILM